MNWDSMSFCIGVIKNITENSASEEESMLAFGVFNAVLAVPTAAANALVILAILTTFSLRTPSYLLLTSLAFSDLAVGLLGQPAFAFSLILFRNGSAQSFCYFLFISGTLLALLTSATFLTFTAISVDRYLAIRLKMRYRSVVTVRRVRFILMSVWIHSMFAACSPFFMPLIAICIVAASELVMCLTVNLICYTMSFRALKIHCTQTHPQGNQQQPNSTTQSNTIDVLKYRKLLKTMILVLVLIIVCSLPLFVVFIMGASGSTNDIVNWSFLSVTALNSLFNPVIYMTRMNDLRHVCVVMLRRVFRLGKNLNVQD